MEICVFEVDWKVFEKTFPKPGEWMEVCDSQIDFDAFGFNLECASIYGRVRSKLDEGVKANWAKAKAEMFESPKDFSAYVKNWIKVLKAIKKPRKGLAIDIFT